MKTIYIAILTILFSACATFKPQYKTDAVLNTYPKHKKIAHTFYLIGDAGNSARGETAKALQAFKNVLHNAEENSTALFLGDNIYPEGLPDKKNDNYKLYKHRLEAQIEVAKDFKGRSIFIAGNHDWYSGLKGLKAQAKMVEKTLGKTHFLPKAGCPIDNIHISDDLELIIIDSYWYLTNWDRHPKINDNCDIKTRTDFLNEFSSLIKKARGKTTIVALHHPLFSNGAHGGEFSFKDHMKPLPVLGTLKNILRKTTGISREDISNKQFNDFKSQLVTLAQDNKKVVLVSGHEHNLQYIIQDNMRQIVSGSGSKTKAVRNKGNGLFGYATSGYAKLTVFEDGASHATFYSVDDNAVVFETQVFPANEIKKVENYPGHFPTTTKQASIYTEEETKKSKFHRFIWGDRYRKYYSTKVTVPTVNLDTLFGGLTIGRRGGGTQSKSLRLITKDGKKQYVMRAMRKQGAQFIQASGFKNQYVKDQFEDTATERLVLDVFTGSHPYASFIVGDLCDAAGIYHLNPKLYYVPKQKALGNMNTFFGDELYMIEEHGSDGHGDQASFGFSDTVESTLDVMKKLKKKTSYAFDEPMYIRARLFDMLIGDWDRHQDQWRWLEFKEDDKTIFRPLPRDRDQAFSIMSDGFLLGAAVGLIPGSRILRKYSEDLKDVKGTTIGRFPLDVAFIQNSRKDIWLQQAQVLQETITDAVIDKAFSNLPSEVIDKSIDNIKTTLKARRSNLVKIAERYFKVINKYVVIKGTNKKDIFDIERLPNGKTKVTGYYKRGDETSVFHQRIYHKNENKEIWIYGLDGKDTFNVFGKGDHLIGLRLIGGQNKDTYDIKEGKKVTFYDYKSKSSHVVTSKGRERLSDIYETNTYNYKKLKNNTTQISPILSSNPDDGFKTGFHLINTNYGFERNPFSSQHKLNVAYYFATKGFDASYSGEFANLFPKINFGVSALIQSPNYAVNFFGFGNETQNLNAIDRNNFSLNYNRVRIQKLKIAPYLVWRGRLGAAFKTGISYENNVVERTEGRFIETLDENSPIFSTQNFFSIDSEYHYKNKDNNAFPTLGFQMALQFGYIANLDSKTNFGYLNSEIGFDYKLIESGNVVLATRFKGQVNLGDDFEFYQAATIGANNGLRGFRNERFTGKHAYTHATDMRWKISDVKNHIIPMTFGVFGGFDYGRVWYQNQISNQWHNAFGGGLFFNIVNMISTNVSVFKSSEDLRFAFKFGFGF